MDKKCPPTNKKSPFVYNWKKFAKVLKNKTWGVNFNYQFLLIMNKEKNSELVITKSTKNIVPLTAIISLTLIIISYNIVNTIVEGIVNIKTTNVRMDKFTYCMQTVMTEHTKAGKFLDAKEAKEICKSLEK